MRLSSFRTVRIAPGLAVPLVTLLLACGEAPTDPTGLTEGLPVAFGHVAGGEGHGQTLTLTILQQPVVSANKHAPGCLISYSFQIEARGRERQVRWTTYWSGNDHDPTEIGSNLATVGSKFAPHTFTPSNAHADDGHSFDALHIVLTDTDPDDRQVILAEAYTEGGTISCS
jgi:hypothetical protein